MGDVDPMLRLADAPTVDVELMDEGSQCGGLNEMPAGLVGAAIANAVFSASGRRLRSLPLLASWRREG